jgi:thiol-disulfide isomerase/thioredoxin
VKLGKTLAAWMALILGAALSTTCARPAPEQAVEIGTPAPVFKLQNLAGRQVSLDQFRGKVVLLDFWATWCNPCRMTMPLVEKLQKEYSDTLALLAVNLQEPEAVVKDYVQKQGINSEVLLDENGSVGESYGTESIPMQVLIDRNGIVRNIHIGYSPSMISKLRAEIQQLQK